MRPLSSAFTAAARAQDTTTEREAARDVLRKMSALEQSLDVPAIVTRLTGPNAERDQVVARADCDAVRRRRERRGDRELSIWGDADGLTEIFGRLRTTDAHAVDARLDALAATVCADDPRTRKQFVAAGCGHQSAGAAIISEAGRSSRSRI